jgi:N-methylhydantoinase B
MSGDDFTFRSHPADFEILYSALKNFTLEMGITMERTSRSPIYFAAHDFSTAIFDRDGYLVTLSEYIPIHICAAPFAVRAALKMFGDNIHPGDIILTNDPYTLDAGNHLADWSILVPVFHEGELWFWSVNRAHQMDTGGGQTGAYNPNAQDIFAEGVRIPPLKIFEGGRVRQDVFDYVLANVRFPESQRGDLWSMIGSAKVGERRLTDLMHMWSAETVKDFLTDLYAYTEYLMREEISKVPDGTYYGETYSDGRPGIGPPVALRCKTTVAGDIITIDLSDTDPMIDYYINSTVPNTYSSVFIALMTSIGRTIQYRSEGVMKAVEIITKPGTLAHAIYPAPVGLCTLYVAKQLIEVVWDSLAKIVPEKTPAGWGGFAGFTISGIDPRRNEGYATPDFLADSDGSGAIWGTDGWHAGASPICAGGMTFPEIEICESIYPALWEKWEITRDSGGPGRWRGGCGMESTFVLEADAMQLCQSGEHFTTLPSPAVAGGYPPPEYNKQVFHREDGTVEDGSGLYYVLKRGEKLACFCQGGCGVGDPLDRDLMMVGEDVRNELVSVNSAAEDYGVVIDPQTSVVDEESTLKLRERKKKDRA